MITSPLSRLKDRIGSLIYRKKGGKPSAAAKQRSKRKPSTSLQITTKTQGRQSQKSDEVVHNFSTILRSNFSKNEIKDIRTSADGVKIIIGEPGDGNDAAYCGIDHGQHTFIFRDVCDEEAVTHEVTHLLQKHGRDRPQIDREMDIFHRTPEEESLNEALTEAEMLGRVQKVNTRSENYYSKIKSKGRLNAEEMKKADRITITGDTKKSIKERSPKVVHEVFDDLYISEYKADASKKTAKQQYQSIKDKKGKKRSIR